MKLSNWPPTQGKLGWFRVVVTHRAAVSSIVTLLLLCSLVLILAFPSSARKFLNAAAICAGIGLLLSRDKPRREIWLLLTGIVLFSFYRILHTFILSDWDIKTLTEQRYVDSGKRLLTCGLICYFYAVSPFPLQWRRYVLFAVVFSVCLAGITVGWQEIHGVQRPGGELVATSFAYNVVMIYIFYQTALLRLSRPSDFWQFLGIFTLSFVVIVVSHTRSALLLLLAAAFLKFALGKMSRHYRYGALIVVCFSLVLAWPQLHARVHNTLYDLSSYYSGSNRTFSIGARFEMWRFAWEVIQQHPIWGLGYPYRFQLAHQLVNSHVLDPVISRYVVNHLHNEFLDEGSVRGIVGGVFLLIFYMAPLALGGRPLQNRAFVLMLTCATLGLTDVLFQDRANTVTVCLLLPLCVGLQLSENRRL